MFTLSSFDSKWTSCALIDSYALLSNNNVLTNGTGKCYVILYLT